MVCERERASSNRSGQVEATKMKSISQPGGSPPPSLFDPRPGRSEPGRLPPRLHSRCALLPGEGRGSHGVKEEQGVKGEHCGGGGSVAASKVPAGPWSWLGEDRKVGTRRPPSEQQGANLRAGRGERGDGRRGAQGTPGHTRKGGRRVWPQEGGLRSAKRKPWSRRRGGTQGLGKP